MTVAVLEVRAGCAESLAAIALLDWAGEEFQLEYVQDAADKCVPQLRRADQQIGGFASMARRALLKTPLYDGTAEQRASVDQWLDTVYSDVRPLVSALSQKDNATATEDLASYLADLEKHLGEGKFLCGDNVTVADIAFLFEILPALRFFLGVKRLNKLPKLVAYVRSLTVLPQLRPLVGSLEFAAEPLVIVTPKATEKKPVEKKPVAEKKKPAEVEEEEPRESKKEYVFPDTAFNFYDFKTLYVNAPKKQDALDFLWANWDANAFSFWRVRYDKLENECKKLFLTKNLMTGFISRAEPCRKHCLGVHGVYGEELDFEIRGVWLWRGTDILEPMKEHEQFEVYQFKKLDPLVPQDKALIEEYWTKIEEGDIVEGKKLQQPTCFK